MATLVSLLGLQPGVTTTTTPYQTTSSGSAPQVFGATPAAQPTLSDGRTIQTGQTGGTVSQAYFQIFNADGTPASQQIFIKTGTAGQVQSITGVAVTTDGNIVVAVDQQSSSTSGTLGYDVYDTNGNPISGYVDGIGYSAANSASGSASVTALANGDFAIQYRTQGTYLGQTTQTNTSAQTLSVVNDMKLGTDNGDALTATSLAAPSSKATTATTR